MKHSEIWAPKEWVLLTLQLLSVEQQLTVVVLWCFPYPPYTSDLVFYGFEDCVAKSCA
jgi:hypothetical protein